MSLNENGAVLVVKATQLTRLVEAMMTYGEPAVPFTEKLKPLEFAVGDASSGLMMGTV